MQKKNAKKLNVRWKRKAGNQRKNASKLNVKQKKDAAN